MTHQHANSNRWTIDLLTASAIGVYLLVVLGATTTLLDGAGACPTWPACGGQWVVSPTAPALVAAWGHRVATVLVGGLLVVTGWMVRRHTESWRVRLAFGLAVLLYPVQIALGAAIVVDGAANGLSAAHLVVAMTIFAGVVLALLWQLEEWTTERGTSSAERADPGPDPATDPGHGSPTGEWSRPSRVPTRRERLVGYVRLTKPKLWWLLCLVAVAAMGLAGGRSVPVGTVVATVTGGVLAIGASGTFNNVLERDVDRRMDRTADRPLIDGTIPVHRAVVFGCALAVASVAVFLLFVNVLAAALGVLAILFYSVVYTVILKPNTTQNVVVGGAVGAFPALIGWAAVENAIGVPAILLGGVIFLWTPAHFYNLALAYREDYERAGIPMLPVVRGEAVTRRHVLLYLGATMLGAVVLGTATRLGLLYATTIVLAGGGFLWAVVELHRDRSDRAAFRAFHASNVYLGCLLVVIAVDSIAI